MSDCFHVSGSLWSSFEIFTTNNYFKLPMASSVITLGRAGRTGGVL